MRVWQVVGCGPVPALIETLSSKRIMQAASNCTADAKYQRHVHCCALYFATTPLVITLLMLYTVQEDDTNRQMLPEQS